MRYLLIAILMCACSDQVPSDTTDQPRAGAGALVQPLELPGFPGSHKWVSEEPRSTEAPWFTAAKLAAAAVTDNNVPDHQIYHCVGYAQSAICTTSGNVEEYTFYPQIWVDKDAYSVTPGSGNCYNGSPKYDYTSYLAHRCTGKACRDVLLAGGADPGPPGSRPAGFYAAGALKFKTVCHSSTQPNGPKMVQGTNIQAVNFSPVSLYANLFTGISALRPCPSSGCTW